LKLATTSATATIEPDVSTIDLDTRRPVGTDAIAQNEIGFCTLKLARPIAVERYADCKDTGGFILIDPESFDTVGMGCVETVFALPRPALVPASTASSTPSTPKPKETDRGPGALD
jgi:sulfate adenylyltransferase subunit 1 (EFTu-like GTPase family)